MNIHEHFRFLAAFLVAVALSCSVAASAQTTTASEEAATTTATTTSGTAAGTSTTGTATAGTERVDSEQIRAEFNRLLDRHPPEVGKILKLDPSLFGNEAYLASYPAIAAFVKEHPEVAHNTRYYLAYVYAPDERAPESASIRLWREMMEGIMVMISILTVIVVFTWLIRTLIRHRRWSRLSRIQTEVHNKLMDRFASNEDLFNYIQTPAGKRFLESAPIPFAEEPQEIAAPINRILWSVQAGVVLAAAGIGLFFVSWNVDKEVAPPLFALGMLTMFVGIGFVASAFVSYAVARRLGVWGGQAQATAE